jgi:peroxiredoxin Q/BCP
MALRINSKAPDFSLQDSEGTEFRLQSGLDKNGVMLFFYPKAFSPGCTKEVCRFSDEYRLFSDAGIRLVGISHDLPETLHRFRTRHSVPFTLLSDPRRTVCRMYDAVYPFGLLTKRISYYIDGSGIIRHYSDNLLNPEAHLREFRSYFQKNPLKITTDQTAAFHSLKA